MKSMNEFEIDSNENVEIDSSFFFQNLIYRISSVNNPRFINVSLKLRKGSKIICIPQLLQQPIRITIQIL